MCSIKNKKNSFWYFLLLSKASCILTLRKKFKNLMYCINFFFVGSRVFEKYFVPYFFFNVEIKLRKRVNMDHMFIREEHNI